MCFLSTVDEWFTCIWQFRLLLISKQSYAAALEENKTEGGFIYDIIVVQIFEFAGLGKPKLSIVNVRLSL